MPSKAFSRRLGGAVITLMLALGATPVAQAGMVDTDRVLDEVRSQRQSLLQALERDEVRAQLESMGVAGADARQRVARLTDTEIRALHQRVNSLPAGGNISTVELLLIIILIVILI